MSKFIPHIKLNEKRLICLTNYYAVRDKKTKEICGTSDNLGFLVNLMVNGTKILFETRELVFLNDRFSITQKQELLELFVKLCLGRSLVRILNKIEHENNIFRDIFNETDLFKSLEILEEYPILVKVNNKLINPIKYYYNLDYLKNNFNDKDYKAFQKENLLYISCKNMKIFNYLKLTFLENYCYSINFSDYEFIIKD